MHVSNTQIILYILAPSLPKPQTGRPPNRNCLLNPSTTNFNSGAPGNFVHAYTQLLNFAQENKDCVKPSIKKHHPTKQHRLFKVIVPRTILQNNNRTTISDMLLTDHRTKHRKNTCTATQFFGAISDPQKAQS